MLVNKGRITYSLLAALAFTIMKILHTKIGGLISGGRYSESHTWSELASMIPSFFSFFGISFLLAYFVLYYVWRK